MRLKCAWDKTYEAVKQQLTAMGTETFEVGALQRSDGDQPQFMLLRTWKQNEVIESIPWLLHQNWHGGHIYVRPKSESNLTLIDDLKIEALAHLRREGLPPTAVVRTSPGNYQVWIKHSARLDKELGTAVARTLAERFGGDVKAADWRHFGRLVGFRNTKIKYKEVLAVPEYDDWRGQNFHRNLDGQWVDREGKVHAEGSLQLMHAKLVPRTRFPFVRLVESSGIVAQESARLIAVVRAVMERERAGRERARARFQAQAAKRATGEVKGIEAFRADPRYGGDGTRVDLAYAVYAVARGADVEEVRAALRSRDLSHKGNEKRQSAYIERTVRKALVSVEQVRGR